jgi:NADH-quinone oxidoreductase subunit J
VIGALLAAQIPDGARLTSDDVDIAQNIAFGVIALVMLYSAVRVVTTRNVVHAALYLVIVLAGVAAVFLLAGAEFIAATQVLVYIGAIVVLFLFGIMLTRARLGEDEMERSEQRGMAALVAVLLAAVTGYALVDGFENTRFDVAAPTTTAQVADSIFSQYIVPFEAASVLLLAALIGAIVIARRD